MQQVLPTALRVGLTGGERNGKSWGVWVPEEKFLCTQVLPTALRVGLTGRERDGKVGVSAP